MSLANNKTLARLSSFAVRARRNRLYSVQEKENGFKELVVYKMTWK